MKPWVPELSPSVGALLALALFWTPGGGASETSGLEGGPRPGIERPARAQSDAVRPVIPSGHARRQPFLCTVGRFQVEGGPLVPGRVGVEADVVSLMGGHMAVDGLCPPALATFLDLRDGTHVIAHWPACPGLPRGAHLEATIDPGTCSNMRGAFHAPGVVAGRRVEAGLVRCLEGGGRAEAEDCEPADLLALYFQRWRTHFIPRAYPDGFISKDAMNKAYGQIVLAPIALDEWVSIGPAPIGDPAGDPPAGDSGRVDAVAIDPGNPDHWLIGASTGGIWETTDGGTTWEPRTDAQPSPAMSAIAFAPGSPAVAYAGTGHYSIAGGNGLPGVGLLKSQDGGQTWALMAASTFEGLGFAALQVSGESPNELVAATSSGLETFFGNYAPPGAPAPGVYRSSTGGTSWSLALPGQATDVVAHPEDFTRQYSAFRSKALFELIQEGVTTIPADWQTSGFLGGGVFRSLDGGAMWTPISGPWNVPPGRSAEIRLAIAPSQPDTLYVSVRKSEDVSGHLLGLWRTDNAWAPTPTWVEVPQTGLISTGYPAGRPNHVISVHPTDPGVVYGSGVPLWKFAGGVWTVISAQIHGDQNALAWVGTRLVVGNDGGVFSRDEGGGGGPWTSHNTNLAITQFYGGTFHPAAAAEMIGGAQDNGVVKRLVASPPVWDRLIGGDGIGAQPGAMLGQWMYWLQHLNLVRSLDDGVTFQSAANNIGDIKFSPFLSRVVRCPSDPDTVLAGSKSLWRTDSFFSTPLGPAIPWAANGPAVGPLANPFQNFVSAIAFAPSDPTCQSYAFAGDKGPIYLTTDGGGSWTDLDANNQVPDRYITGLAFGPSGADTLYVTLSGFDESTPGKPGHVFKTTSATSGAVWANVSPPANLPANVVAHHPTLAGVIYVGTDLGLWISQNGGSSWAHAGPSAGLPHVPVMDIAIDPCGVTAFTFGRGAFRNAVPFVCP